MDKVLLYSGGIDSFVAWHYCDYPKTVYFSTKSRYAIAEERVIKWVIPSTIIDRSLDLSAREQEHNAYVPFRNLLFAAQAVHYADTIIIAGLEDDNVSDKNEQVFKKFSALLSELEGRPINVISPFWHMTKSEVVYWFLTKPSNPLTPKERIDVLLHDTISCYSGKQYCGKCPSCFRKWTALRANGIKQLPFHNSELVEEYYQSALKMKYNPTRCNDIIRSVEDWRKNGYSM